jgi:hypothetical protein
MDLHTDRNLEDTWPLGRIKVRLDGALKMTLIKYHMRL